MPVADHLKAAAAELSKAVDLLRHEIDDLRAEERNLRNLLDRQVTSLAQQMHIHDQELKRVDSGMDTSHLKNAMRDVDSQISQTKKQQQEEQNRIADAIRDREGLINHLQSQANVIMP
jgi:vacuolar-type H+-ATPase catalytic subunit A/Vma1